MIMTPMDIGLHVKLETQYKKKDIQTHLQIGNAYCFNSQANCPNTTESTLFKKVQTLLTWYSVSQCLPN